MDQLISRFTEQLEEALDIGRNASIRPLDGEVSHVFVAGLGGSGIGADFVSTFIDDKAGVPYLVGKQYDIPAYIGKNSLCFASSYSGNTEETLSSVEQILKTGARLICFASGGKLIDIAKERDLDYIEVPGNWPSPRACLGYSLVGQLSVLTKLGLAQDQVLRDIESSIALLRKESDDIKQRAESVAGFIFGKTPVIYGTDRLSPMCVRFRQQINENAKALCWHHIIPEMNHNELVGWRDKRDDLAVIYFRSNDDHPRNKVRIDINKEIIGNCTGTIIELYAKGSSLIEQSMYLVHLGDWISWYLAQMRGMDAVEVKVIDYLKSELSKV